LLILFLIVVGLGLYFDWFSFSMNRNEEGKGSGVTFNVNRERIAKDTERASQAVKNLGKKLAPAGGKDAATQTVKGTLMSVNEAARQLTLKTGADQPVTVRVPTETKIRRNDVEVNMGGLMTGDLLEVIYRDEGGKHVADSVTVVPGA